jgi:hypothetical protein
VRYIPIGKRVMAMAVTPDARPAWRVTYLDFSVIVVDEEIINRAQAGDITARCNVIAMFPKMPRNHLTTLDGKPDPTAPFRKGLTITRVA